MCFRVSVYVIRSFTYVLRVVIYKTVTARENARGNNNGPSYVPSKRKEEIKSGTSGCGSFVVPYFQPATSIDRLHTNIRLGICWYCSPFRLIYQIKERKKHEVKKEKKKNTQKTPDRNNKKSKTCSVNA